MRRLIAATLTWILILPICPVIASANAPGPAYPGEARYVKPVIVIVLLLISVFGTLFTMLVEWMLCKPFGIGNEYRRLVLGTNLVTQLLLRFLQLFTFALAPEGMSLFAWSAVYLAILEFLVYLAEFLVYIRKMRDISWIKCLLYTVSANTVSLLGGLILLFMIW